MSIYGFWYELVEGETQWHKEGKETVTRVPGGWVLDKYEENQRTECGCVFLGFKASCFIPYNEEFKSKKEEK